MSIYRGKREIHVWDVTQFDLPFYFSEIYRNVSLIVTNVENKGEKWQEVLFWGVLGTYVQLLSNSLTLTEDKQASRDSEMEGQIRDDIIHTGVQISLQ